MKQSFLALTAAAGLALVAFAPSATAVCPNKCNGHGTCGAWDRCTCHVGYTNADCSGMICPYAISWADVADTSTIASRTPHFQAECSDRGVCNRESGECECYEGFEGSACQRMSCPESCSGHGTCMQIGDANSGYALWDANKMQLCSCDPGWEGLDCSQRMCPVGDDPMSTYDSAGAAEVAEIQQIVFTMASLDTSSDFVLGYTDYKSEHYKTHPIPYPPTAIQVEEALMALPNHVIPSVSVTVAAGSNSDQTLSITFSDAKNSGNQPDLTVYTVGCVLDGCQPVYHGTYLVDGTTKAATALTTPTPGTSESLTCSNRGLCNAEEGNCECFEGFYGDACQYQTVIM